MARQAIKLRRPTIKNFFILMGGEAAARLFTFIAFAYLARTVGPTAYGYIAPSYAVLMFCMLIVDMGFGTLGTRDIARDHKVTAHLVNRVMSAQLLLAAAVLVTLIMFCLLLPVQQVYVKLLTGLGISLLGIPFLLNWVFQGRNEMLLFTVPMALRQCVFLIVVVLLISEPGDVTYLPLAEIAAVAVAGLFYVLAYLHLGEKIGLSLHKGLDRELFSHALPIGGAQIIWALRMYLPIVMAGTILGPEAAGLFDAGHRIAMVLVAFMGVYFINLLPAMSLTSHESADELSHLLVRAVLLSVIPSVVLALVIIGTAPAILGLVYGDAFVNSDSINAFCILVWIIPLLAGRRNGRTALISLNCQRIDFRISIAGVILMVCMAIPATMVAGIVGTAWVMVISELVTTIVIWLYLVPEIKKACTARREFH